MADLPGLAAMVRIMRDDFASLFAFDRWANTKMLDACRELTPEQYAAEPIPGWSSVRFTDRAQDRCVRLK